jgi:hypothetical protein
MDLLNSASIAKLGKYSKSALARVIVDYWLNDATVVIGILNRPLKLSLGLVLAVKNSRT